MNNIQKRIQKEIGPRQSGTIYKCAYWEQTCRVVAVAIDGTRWAISEVEIKADGSETAEYVHSTAWAKGDKVISQPTA